MNRHDSKVSKFLARGGAAYSSASVEWATPWDLFHVLDAEFGFTLDACAQSWNAKCERYFSPSDNGLVQDWGKEIVFCNPPYGRGVTGAWVAKGWEASQRGATVVLLIPARTDTSWWHEGVVRGEVRFLRGRVQFERRDGVANSAPFPSAVVIFRPGRRRRV